MIWNNDVPAKKQQPKNILIFCILVTKYILMDFIF